MSATFLTTLSIVLIEIIVILLIFLTILFLRFRKLKSTLSDIKPLDDSNTANDEKVIPFLTHLNDEINRTNDKLAEAGIGDEHKAALSHRLELLTKEKHIADSIEANDDYWTLIDTAYSSDHPDTENNVVEQGDREAIYLARIKNLENFKTMFFNTQAKLKESFDIIDALKHKISEMPSSEENAQLEEMIDKLSIDNIGLNKQLDSANKELNAILDEAPPQTDDVATSTPTEVSEDAVEQLKQTQEENDFLASQIQFLLQQELENTSNMQEKITTIEQALKNKEVECESLKSSDSDQSEQGSEELKNKLQSFEEENEFLTLQIQHLLHQELDNTTKMQEKINSMETALRFKEAELESLKSKDTPPSVNSDEEEWATKLAAIEEENEFLASQIQHLLRQELEATEVMQGKISSMETDLRFKEAEIEALKSKNSSADKPHGKEPSTELEDIEEENEFLASQIHQLLKQEIAYSNNMQTQMVNLETSLKEKEAECNTLKEQASSADDTQAQELNNKLHSMEEENEFLVSQIQHLLAQEVEHTKNMQDKIQTLEQNPDEKQ